MLSRSTSRSDLWTRSMRTGVAWFALLALALPGFASVRGLCCEPGVTKGPDCCPSAMKMPGTESSQMAAMIGAPITDVRVAAAAECAMARGGDAPEFIVRSKGFVEQDLLPDQSQLPAVVATPDEELVAAVAPSFFVYKTPHRLFLFDPLSVSLRV